VRGNTPAEVRAWLSQMLRNNVADFVAHYRTAKVRRVDREIRLDDASMELIHQRVQVRSVCVSTAAQKREAIEALSHALAQLPGEHRQVVVWRDLHKVRFAVIGQRLRISENAARKLWLRALSQLRQQLGNCHAPD
jgi:RNA polymerase sigma factor (sigma-70 family)